MEDAVNGVFNNLLDVGLAVAVTVCAFFLMWGAFVYMSAAGSPRQMESGKSAMLNALMGLGIALAARTIAGVVERALASAT